MRKNRRYVPSPLFFVAGTMFITGMTMAETGASMSRMTAQLGIGAAEQGYLVSARYIGGVVIGLMLWAGSARINLRVIYRAAVAAIALSGLFLLLPGYGFALAIAIFRGLAVGALIPLSGVYAANQTERPVGPVTATVNATLSAGLVLVALASLGLSAIPGVAWQVYWTLPSALAAVLLLVSGGVEFPAVGSGGAVSKGDGLMRRTDWVIAAASAFTVSAEAVLIGLIPYRTAAISAVNVPGELVALVLVSGIMIGRFLSGRWLMRLGSRTVLVRAIVSLVVFAVIWTLLYAFGDSLSPVFTSILFLVLVFSLGLSSAALFPAIVSYTALQGTLVATATVAAIGWTAGVGGTSMPAVAGEALEAGLSPTLAMLFVAGPALIALGMIWAHSRSHSLEGS